MREKEKRSLTDYYKVKAKLEEHNMMFKDVKRIVGLTKPKVLYYIAQELKLSGKEHARNKHARHLFSAIDVFGLAIIKELRELHIQLELCRLLFRLFQECLTKDYARQGTTLIHELSSSNPMILWLDVGSLKSGLLMVFVGKFRNELYKEFMKMNKPCMAIPLNHIYKSVLKKIKRKDFQIKLIGDGSGERKKVIYRVDGQTIDIVQHKKSEIGYLPLLPLVEG